MTMGDDMAESASGDCSEVWLAFEVLICQVELSLSYVNLPVVP